MHIQEQFKEIIWQYYHIFGRKFAWRNIDNPYAVLVSEIMLQQTQTYRVAPKFELFIKRFANFKELAYASTQAVICTWQGLGYNRRALALKAIAKRVVDEFDEILPQDPELLQTFKGIGSNTAGSICAFAFNKPVVFIETNIRAVYIHYFFYGKEDVHDRDILPIIKQTLDHTNPREWYYALMDYGVMLKKQFKNPARRSAHHNTQSRFEGSNRQIRGSILKYLAHQEKSVDRNNIYKDLPFDKNRIEQIIDQLLKEGFLEVHENSLKISH